MGTTRLFRRSVLVLALTGLLAGYGWAAPANNESSSSDLNAATAPMMGAQSTDLVRASSVVGAKIKSPQGETLGQVSDIVLTPDLDSVAYVAMSRGGVFGMGNLMYAVPWSALSSGINGSFVLSVTKSQLEQSRGFDQDNWPSRPAAAWMVQDQQRLYGAPDTNGGSVFPRRFSRLKGTNVKATEGNKVGDIQDFVIAKDTGQIAYTIVSHGGLFGMGQKLAAIPHSAITLEPALDTARVNASKAVVQANSFPPGRWPGLASPAYSEQVARAYGVAPAGTTLAYVPPEDTTAVARAPRSTTTPSTRSTTPPVSDNKTSALMAEPKAEELTGTFEASNIKTIDGTVVAVGKFQPASGSEMLWLRVRPETGQPVLVNLGPRSYIGTQDFYIVPGDRIHLSGAQVKAAASGKQVFLPTEVRYEGQTLHLRSATGTPLWEGQAGTAGSASTSSQTQSKAEPSGTGPLGYAPAEDEDSATAAGRSGTAPSAAPSAAAAEPTSEELTGRFNPSAVTSIDGTVMDAGKIKVAESNQDMLWLRVRTNEGRTVLVNLGPRNYVSSQDFYIVRGDRIHLKGSEAASTAAAGRQVFLPTEVTYNNHTLRLRSATGTPLWEGRTGTMEPSTSSETQSKDSTSGTPPLGYTPSEPGVSTGTSDMAGRSEPDAMDKSDKNIDKNADTARIDRGSATGPNGSDLP